MYSKTILLIVLLGLSFNVAFTQQFGRFGGRSGMMRNQDSQDNERRSPFQSSQSNYGIEETEDRNSENQRGQWSTERFEGNQRSGRNERQGGFERSEQQGNRFERSEQSNNRSERRQESQRSEENVQFEEESFENFEQGNNNRFERGQGFEKSERSEQQTNQREGNQRGDQQSQGRDSERSFGGFSESQGQNQRVGQQSEGRNSEGPQDNQREQGSNRFEQGNQRGGQGQNQRGDQQSQGRDSERSFGRFSGSQRSSSGRGFLSVRN